MLLDHGSFVELDEFVRHRTHAFGMDSSRPYGDAVVTGLGTIHGRQVAVYAQDFTIFGGSLGEVAGEKIVKVMDHAHQDRRAHHRHARLRRRAHPGRRCRARQVRRDLQAQHARIGRHPADLDHHGARGGRGGLLAGAHRLRDHGRQDLADVRDRSRRHQDRHRRGRRHGGARRRTDPQHGLRGLALHRKRRGRCTRLRADAHRLPARQQPRRARCLRGRRRARDHRRGSPAQLDRAGQPQPAVRHDDRSSSTSSTTRDFLEVQPLFAPNIVIGFGRVEGRTRRRHRQPAEGDGRHAQHRRGREGGAVPALLRRVQHPRSSPSSTCRDSCRAPTRSGPASSVAARSCSTPTRRRRCRS